MPFDAILVIIVSLGFALMFIFEKSLFLKLIFGGFFLGFLIASMFSNYNLTTTTFFTNNGVTTYTYTIDNNLATFGSGLWVLPIIGIGLLIILAVGYVLTKGVFG